MTSQVMIPAVMPLSGVDPDALAAVKEVTLSLDTNEYVDGDVLAATQEITNFFLEAGGKRRLVSVVINDKDAIGEGLDLVLMRSNVSIGVENAVADCDPDDADEILTQVKISWEDYIDLNSCKVAVVGGLDVLLKAAAGATSIWLAAISRGVATHTAAGITLKLGVV